MAVATINAPANYGQALEMLAGKQSRKLGHNTYLSRYTEIDQVTISFHGNTIAYLNTSGYVVTLAGWDTYTTRGRLNQIPGVKCGRIKGQTYINDIPVLSNQLVEIGA